MKVERPEVGKAYWWVKMDDEQELLEGERIIVSYGAADLIEYQDKGSGLVVTAGLIRDDSIRSFWGSPYSTRESALQAVAAHLENIEDEVNARDTSENQPDDTVLGGGDGGDTDTGGDDPGEAVGGDGLPSVPELEAAAGSKDGDAGGFAVVRPKRDRT